MSAFACEYPDHEGVDRHVAHPYDRFSKRVTYMRADNKQRLFERTTMRLCRACVKLDAEASGALPTIRTGSLW